MLGALGIAVVLLLCGCGSEPFIESYAPSWSYVVGTAAPALELRQEPGGILRNSDVYAAANGKPLSSPPAAIVPFREALLLLLAEESALELLERTSFRSRARIPLPQPSSSHCLPQRNHCRHLPSGAGGAAAPGPCRPAPGGDACARRASYGAPRRRSSALRCRFFGEAAPVRGPTPDGSCR
jgi:hypothetical protein